MTLTVNALIGAAMIVLTPAALQLNAQPAPIPEPPVETLTPALSDEDRAGIVAAAADALTRVESARGRFLQTAPDFSVTEGDFALRRPGRVRFEYDDPTPILIIADGATVAIEDRDLETLDRVPLSATPLNLVLDDEIDFETEAEVTNVRRQSDYTAISIQDRTGEAEGELTLFFDTATYDLLAWATVDPSGNRTIVELKDVETNVRISPRAFRIEDPEDEDERRR